MSLGSSLCALGDPGLGCRGGLLRSQAPCTAVFLSTRCRRMKERANKHRLGVMGVPLLVLQGAALLLLLGFVWSCKGAPAAHALAGAASWTARLFQNEPEDLQKRRWRLTRDGMPELASLCLYARSLAACCRQAGLLRAGHDGLGPCSFAGLLSLPALIRCLLQTSKSSRHWTWWAGTPQAPRRTWMWTWACTSGCAACTAWGPFCQTRPGLTRPPPSRRRSNGLKPSRTYRAYCWRVRFSAAGCKMLSSASSS